MRKFLLTMIFILLLTVPALADYTVDSVSVSANVAQDGETEVSAVFQLTFDTSERKVTIPLPETEVSHLSADNYRSKKKNTDDGVNVIVSGGTFSGTQTITISYTVPASIETGDDGVTYAFRILSSRWAKNIGNCSFYMTLPGPYTAIEGDYELSPQVSSGYYGLMDDSDCGLTMTGNLIEGSVDDLMAYDALSMTILLPEGYFYIRSTGIPALSITWLSLGMLALLLLSLIYWRIFVYSKHLPVSERVMAPDGILPCQLPMVLDGRSIDMAALMFEWANLGYVMIRRRKGGQVQLVRGIPLGTERSAAEQQLYRRIFSRKTTVTLSPGRLSSSAGKYRRSVRKALNKTMMDPKGGNHKLLRYPALLLAALGIGYAVYTILPNETIYALLGILAGLIGWVYASQLYSALQKLMVMRQRPLKLWILLLVGIAVIVAGLLGGALIEAAVGILGCIILACINASGPRRSEKGTELLQQARGLRRYYLRLNWQRLQVLIGRSPNYYQNELPSLIALRIEDTIARRMEDHAVAVPDWLRGVGRGNTTAKKLNRKLKPVIRTIRDAFS